MKRDQEPGPSEFSHGRGLDPLGVQRYRGRAASETVSEGLSADACAASRVPAGEMSDE